MSRSSFEIHVTAPFDFQQCLQFLRRSNDEVMHVARETSVSKLFDVDGRLLLGDIMETSHGLVIVFPKDDITSAEQAQVERYVRDWFDLDQDVAAFVRMVETDELLRPLVREYEGLRLIGFPDLFEALTWAVIGQQITLSFAYTLKRRFVEQYGPSREVDGVTYWAFPNPETIALLDPSELRPLQFSTRKAEYIIGIAQEMTDGRLSKQQLRSEPPDMMHERLLSLRGVGEWTAAYVRMKCFQDPTAFPAADAGLHQALKHHLGRGDKLTADEVRLYGERFSGWEAYATFYLWRSLYGDV